MEAVPRIATALAAKPGEVSRLNSAHRVNIAEVAAAAGVSVGTVSRVLNESPNVREHTRRRVAEVMKRLNYRPSRLAESLSRGQTRTVVILVPFLTRPSVTERLAGAIGVLDGAGFDTVVRNVETIGQRDRHLAALTTRHEADGAVIVSLRLNRRAHGGPAPAATCRWPWWTRRHRVFRAPSWMTSWAAPWRPST